MTKQLTLPTQKLKRVLTSAFSIVESRNVISELECFRITVSPEQIEVTATNVDAEITEVIQLDPQIEAFEFDGLIKAVELLNAVKAVKRDEVKLTFKDDFLTVSAGRQRFKLKLFDSAQFPVPFSNQTDYDVVFTMPVSDFSSTLSKLTHAMGTDETRAYFLGVYFDFTQKVKTLASCDGNRLATCDVEPVFSPSDSEGSWIVPDKIVNLLTKMKYDDDETIVCHMADNVAKFSVNGTTIATKLIDGNYPDYRRISAGASTATATISTSADELKDACQTCLVVGNTDKVHGIAVHVGETLKMDIVLSNGSDTSYEFEDFELDGSIQEEYIGVNGKFLEQAASALDGEITVKLTSDRLPLHLTDGKVLCSVMPMMLKR